MKIKRKKIYLSLLTVMIPTTFSYTENFKHDSVISPLKLGEYKFLNGCPAILKTETKEEDNCPKDYSGTIEYERTLNADRVLFGDNVACENGGTWSAWKEIKNNCVPIPPPMPNDLLKSDSCKMLEVNGNSEEWYYFRRNPNQVFLKSNYDAAISSGTNAETYYSNLIKTNTEKTYANATSFSCNIQVMPSEFNRQYVLKKDEKSTTPIDFFTLYASNYAKYSVTSLKLDISILNEKMEGTNVYINGNMTGDLKLKNMQSLILNNINYVADSIILESIGYTKITNNSSVKANTFNLTGAGTNKLEFDMYNNIDIGTLKYTGAIVESRTNGGLNAFKVKNLDFQSSTPTTGGITMIGYNLTVTKINKKLYSNLFIFQNT